MKRLFLLFLIPLASFLIPSSTSAQERVLLHIDRNGQQEAIPLKKGERAQDVIARIEGRNAALASPQGLIDTLKYFPNDAALTSNFGWNHQDMALQWYTPAAGGRVKEIWWNNYQKGGNIRKATIRAWYVDPRLATRPVSVQTKFMGAYKDPLDGDGNVTPFKPSAGNQWFYGNGAADSSSWNFDPLGTEVQSFLGGVQVPLDSAKWQGIKLEDWGDTMHVNLSQLFGFTISNDTKKSDIPVGGTDERMEILSYPNTNPAPYHSLKWYESGRSQPGVDNGWHLRGDYEWGMYVVIDYGGCKPPVVSITYIPFHQLNSGSKKIAAYFGGFWCTAPESVENLLLKYRLTNSSPYDSIQMTPSDATNYLAAIPAFSKQDTVSYYVVAVGTLGTRISSQKYHYTVFNNQHKNLLIYNNAQYPLATGKTIYTGVSPNFDAWSGPNDGTGELAELLALYDNVVVADGSFPSRNVYPALSAWLKQASATTQRNLFFSSQDYGCYITPACGDTTFAPGTFENLLGIVTLGPQDQGSTNRPVRIVPQADPITNYLLKYSADSSVTLWQYPAYELAFSAYPDFLTKTASAKSLFTDAGGSNIMGIRNDAEGLHTMFLGFDAGALQFRSDTSLHNAGYTSVTDPHYAWITDVKPLANAFFDAVTGVDDNNTASPNTFGLEQNYPNPFNPTTTIRYSLGARSSVSLTIYNTLGQSVATLINTTQDAGPHSVEFNATRLASGLYFYRLQAGAFTSVKKMIVVK